MITCPLCGNANSGLLPDPGLLKRYAHCPECDLRFMLAEHHTTLEDERRRYLVHNNDVEDPRYQEFVQPLVDCVQRRSPRGACGLDFGAGTGPVLTKLLREAGYIIECYDPHFWPDLAPLQQTYDFIVACEVAEHLREPGRELKRLQQLLRPGGYLAIMTHLYEPGTDFTHWYYRRDPTHIVFYSAVTFTRLGQTFGFSKVEIRSERLVILLA